MTGVSPRLQRAAAFILALIGYVNLMASIRTIWGDGVYDLVGAISALVVGLGWFIVLEGQRER